jgi:hypothetical protein
MRVTGLSDGTKQCADRRATSTSFPRSLEYDTAGAFTHGKALPMSIEWTARLGIHRTQCVKPRVREPSKLVGAHGNGDVTITEPEPIRGKRDCHGAARTRSVDGMTGAVESERSSDLVDQHALRVPSNQCRFIGDAQETLLEPGRSRAGRTQNHPNPGPIHEGRQPRESILHGRYG